MSRQDRNNHIPQEPQPSRASPSKNARTKRRLREPHINQPSAWHRPSQRHTNSDRERPRRNTGAAIELFLALAALLLVVIPLWVLDTVQPQVDKSNAGKIVLSLAVIAISGLRLAWTVARGQPQLFDYAFWTFVYVFLGVPAFAQFITDTRPGTTPDIYSSLDMPTLAIILTSLACYLLGQHAAHWVKPAHSHERYMASPSDALSVARTYVLFAVGAAAWVYYVSRIGVANFFTSRDAISQLSAAAFPDALTRTVLSALSTFPLLIAFQSMVLQRRRQRTNPDRRLFPLFFVPLIMVLITNNLFTASRYTFGTMLFSLLVLAGGFATANRARLSMTAVLATLLLAFPLFSAFRRETTVINALGGTGFATSGDYDSFSQINNAVLYVSQQGIVYGQQFLGPLVFWVPRSIWPDKPIDTGILLANFRGYSFTNLSAPLWAEAYMSGAWVGVILIFVAVGYMFGRLDSNATIALRRQGKAAVSAAVLSFYVLILLRGSLLQATGTFAVIALSILAIGVRQKNSEIG